MITWITLGVIVALGLLGMFMGGRKKRWEKVTMANGDVMCLYRTGADYWFRDKQSMTTFHRPNGVYVKLSNHFTLRREEIDESQVQAIEDEILRLRAKREQEEVHA